MADTALRPDTAHSKLACELKKLSTTASTLEDALDDTLACLHAIKAGGMFDATPADKDAYDSHSAACRLLDMAETRIVAYRSLPGTDLSISLSVLSTNMERC